MANLYFLLHYGFKILHKKFQVILSKNEGGTAIFPNLDLILNLENQHHTFIFAQNDLKLFVQNFRSIKQKKSYNSHSQILPEDSAKL